MSYCVREGKQLLDMIRRECKSYEMRVRIGGECKMGKKDANLQESIDLVGSKRIQVNIYLFRDKKY